MRRRYLEFKVNDWVYLKISFMKGVIRFCKKGKLTPRYVGPYQNLRCIDKFSYQLDFPSELASLHLVFYLHIKEVFWRSGIHSFLIRVRV